MAEDKKISRREALKRSALLAAAALVGVGATKADAQTKGYSSSYYNSSNAYSSNNNPWNNALGIPTYSSADYYRGYSSSASYDSSCGRSGGGYC
jgi:hypothetical protein